VLCRVRISQVHSLVFSCPFTPKVSNDSITHHSERPVLSRVISRFQKYGVDEVVGWVASVFANDPEPRSKYPELFRSNEVRGSDITERTFTNLIKPYGPRAALLSAYNAMLARGMFVF
jgi:hypothetical protein